MTNRGEFISLKNEYNHGADPNQVNSRGVHYHLKIDVGISQFSTQQVVVSNVIGINQSTAATSPSFPLMNRLVRQTQNDANTPLSLRNALASIIIPLINKNTVAYIDGSELDCVV
ncbi:hypothetical protein RF11_04937 [Thelohanellus kitauei]|uniref:Uncharacterized protein n=1 Tax=Thelohanellus kitauei TaxID=669202 RepID=A0A0C2MTE4_THEKT|nr:hypothetical protein RF11_04937 [Thelohanellus kitauei]